MIADRVLRLLVALSGALACATSAAHASEDPCHNEARLTECYLLHQQEFLGPFELRPAETYLSAGAEIYRAMFRDGYGRLVVAIEFVRLPANEPTLHLYLPTTLEGWSPGPALSAAVHARDWEEVRNSSRFFDRVLLPRENRQANGTVITICTHAWLYIVETADPAAGEWEQPLRRRAESACADGTTGQYADLLAKVSVRLLPACALLSDTHNRGDATILSICARFAGDRLAAADALLAFDQLRSAIHRGDRQEVRWSLAPGAHAERSGGEAVRGGAVADLLLEALDRGSIVFVRAAGEHGRRASVQAVIRRWDDEAGQLGMWRHSPVEFVWSRDRHASWRVERVSIGAEEDAVGFCPPGLLTGAEEANDCHW